MLISFWRHWSGLRYRKVCDRGASCPLHYSTCLQRWCCVKQDGFNDGYRIGGRHLSNLRFAECGWHCSYSHHIDDLKTLVQKLVEVAHKYGIRINAQKTKVMTTCYRDSYVALETSRQWRDLLAPIVGLDVSAYCLYSVGQLASACASLARSSCLLTAVRAART